MSDSQVDLEELARVQRQRGELETKRDVWLTAAVMTCFFPPGLLFGLGGLLVMLGSRAALASNDLERAKSKIQLCRVSVGIGTALGGVMVLYWLTQVAGGMASIGLLLDNASGSRR